MILTGRQQTAITLAMELCSSDLHGMSQLTNNRRQEIVRQIFEGLAHLHSVGIIHRDLKPENILLTKSGVVKIADLNCSRSVHKDSSGRVPFTENKGTVAYRAPEILLGATFYNESIDIWSVGCTIIELWTGSPPYFEVC